MRRACQRLPKLKQPLPPPEALPVAPSPREAAEARRAAGSLRLGDLGLAAMPRRRDGSVVDWGASILAAWRPSEEDALAALDDFLQAGACPPAGLGPGSSGPLPSDA